jgi:DhnA family fructose-bisphosphate aldolase class Ia
MTKRLDRKLAKIRAGAYRPTDFIIADAKDGDMAFGCAAAGKAADGRMKPIRAYRDDMVKVTESNLADIMLMSVSSAEVLTREGLFARTEVTPAVRFNDTTDIWHPRGAVYAQSPALPFRTAVLDRVKPVADLGLYAVTFYNDLEQDIHTLEEYALFREEASDAGLRHFLEIFNPAMPVDTTTGDFAAYNNDMIARLLAGVSRLDRPIFLKAAYNGPAATEEIAAFDPENLVFGILGGGAGTTRDCLELVKQGEKYGARVALFGRKIYYAEDSVLMLRAMRRVIEDGISSEEGVKAYHGELEEAGISAHRMLADDLELTEALLKANLA